MSLDEGPAEEAPERVVAAAVLFRGLTFSVPAPGRHHNVVHKMVGELGLAQTGEWEQGFLTSRGRFVRRKPALRMAREAGQILRETAPNSGLFSEDVW